MRILLTRSTDRNAPLKARLLEAGHDVLEAPLLMIRPLATGPLDIADCGALVFTSANGVLHGAARIADWAIPVYAVGARTALAAHAAGFRDVREAGGDGRRLAAAIAADPGRPEGPLLHVGAKEPRPGLAEGLRAAGLSCRSAAVYETTAADRFPKPVTAALERGDIDLVLLYSPKAAACFGRLLGKSMPQAARGKPVLATLSRAIAEAAGSAADAAIIAPTPDEPALLRAVSERFADFLPPEGPS
ncbi:MAG: hypothetical protein Kow00104_19640 [Rhodothalassiaceae bacterium]